MCLSSNKALHKGEKQIQRSQNLTLPDYINSPSLKVYLSIYLYHFQFISVLQFEYRLFTFFKKKKKLFYLCLVVLGLCCCQGFLQLRRAGAALVPGCGVSGGCLLLRRVGSGVPGLL